MRREPGQSDAEFFGREVGLSRDGWEIIASSTSGGGFSRTFYAAAKKPDGTVIGVVVLQNGSGDNYVYKAMDESMGPNEVGMSRKVLEALTPTDNQYANEWRARALADIEQREQHKKVAKKLQAGDFIILNRPVTLNDDDNEYYVVRNLGDRVMQGYSDVRAADVALLGDDSHILPVWNGRFRMPRNWMQRYGMKASAATLPELAEHLTPAAKDYAAGQIRLRQKAAKADAAAARLDQGRVGRGVPAGGQFAGHSRPDSTVTL